MLFRSDHSISVAPWCMSFGWVYIARSTVYRRSADIHGLNLIYTFLSFILLPCTGCRIIRWFLRRPSHDTPIAMQMCRVNTMPPSCRYSSRANKNEPSSLDQKFATHLCLKLLPDPIFFIGLDNKMIVVQVLDDKTLLLVHRQQYLFHRWIARSIQSCAQCPYSIGLLERQTR